LASCPGPGQSFYGQDANFSGHPLSYVKVNDQVVGDFNTWLLWEVKAPAGSGLINAADKVYTYDEAKAYIDELKKISYGGFSNWRLPDAGELHSLINYGSFGPRPSRFPALRANSAAIDTSLFPNTMADAYWSISEGPGSTVRYVFFDDGCSYFSSKTGPDGKPYLAYVMAVHDVMPELLLREWNPPEERLVDNGDGTVSDLHTGLMWQQEIGDPLAWGAALSYAETLSLAGYSDWRLPNLKELGSLLYDARQQSAPLDTSLLPLPSAPIFWSSTTSGRSPADAWYIAFDDGYPYYVSKGRLLQVRAVRGPDTGGSLTPPTADFSADQTSGLAPLTVTFTEQSSGTVAAWQWDFGDGATSTAQSPTHTYSTVGTYTVSLTVSGPGGADTLTKTGFIVVSEVSGPPVADFSADPTSGPAPLTVSFADQSSGEVQSWMWDLGDGTIKYEQNPSHTYEMPGVYTISLTVYGPTGLSNTLSKKGFIIVEAVSEPLVAGFTADPKSGIGSLDVQFTDASTGPVESWSWDFGDGTTSSEQSPLHNFGPGTYTVTLTVTGGATSSTATDTIIVYEPAVADFTTSPSNAGTAAFTVQFNDASSGAIDSWLWDFGDGTDRSTEQNPHHIYEVAGSYTVTLTVSGNGGTDTLIKTEHITVAPTPVAEFSAGTTNGQAPLEVYFTDNSAGAFASWSWDFGDGTSPSTDQHPYHVYETPGTYTVSLTITDVYGTPSTLTIPDYIVVSEPLMPPVANFTSDFYPGPAPLRVTFSCQSTGIITEWLWDFGDGGTSTEQNPSYTYYESGLYTVTLTVTGPGGSSSKQDYIDVGYSGGGQPVAMFHADMTEAPASHTFQFTDDSTGDITTWSWDFGDGSSSNQQHPSHTYAYPGNYTVSLTVYGPTGSDTTTIAITVTSGGGGGGPTADFNAAPVDGAAPLTVNFSDLSTPAAEIVSWQWSFGDGGTSAVQHPQHIYAAAGTYDVTLTVWNGAGQSDTLFKPGFVVVGVAGPTAFFNAIPVNGPAPLAVQFEDQSTPGGSAIVSWFWEFGDGGTGEGPNPLYIYDTQGTYDVKLTVWDDASATSSHTRYSFINVGAPLLPPVADFTASPTDGTAPLAVTFTDLSTGDITSWTWDFGDGTVESGPGPKVHTYNSSNFWPVTLTVSGPGGSDTEWKDQYIIVW